jgi:hydrogenase/urease accessory protein HupE
VFRLWAALLGFALVFVVGSASAHTTGVSRGEYRADSGTVHALYIFSGRELATTLPDIDANHDGVLSSAEVAGGAHALDTFIVQSSDVEADGVSCKPALDSVKTAEADAVEIRATFACPRSIDQLSIDCQFLERFSADHHHLAVISLGGHETPFVATLSHMTIEADLGSTAGETTTFPAMVLSGIEHILTGYDHLAFLIGLLLLGGRVRSLVGVITAFTVAHSITLGLAALHVVRVSPSIVEPAIALSIAYVGVENLFVHDVSKRWRITFLFGLIHGFGFAGALMNLELPPSKVPLALFAFNLGVEIGQLGVLAVVLPLVMFARKNAWFRDRGVKGLSLLIALAGVVWFVQRVRG